ncbi:hypothetical protein TNCV_4751451 [Trichonephila clavipes]|nr:hypothetical protein TNCV_4751451 [Trichonephila clavipes]
MRASRASIDMRSRNSEIPKPHSSTFPSRGGLASSRAEGAHQATGEKMVRTWHKDGTEEGNILRNTQTTARVRITTD